MTYNQTMGKYYQNSMLKTLSAIQKDLADQKITDTEFQFLLGVLLQSEVDNFVQKRVNDYVSDDSEDCISLFKYQKTSRLITKNA